LPQCEEDQSRLVLLDRVLRFAGWIHPRMPAATRIASRRVLVPKVALPGDDSGAELEEAPRQVDVASLVHGINGEGGVARPHIAIGVTGELDDVGVIRGENGASAVDLGSNDQQAAAIQLRHSWREIGELAMLLAHPCAPVGSW